MEKFTIQRTGAVPLAFEGEQLTAHSGWMVAGKDQTRWHEVAVYRTTSGRYVVAIAFCTRWEGEEDWYTAAVCDTLDAVAEALEYHDPLAHLVGFPSHPTFADKQRALEDTLADRWASILSRTLADLGIVETVD